jgi:hypothetical protein
MSLQLPVTFSVWEMTVSDRWALSYQKIPSHTYIADFYALPKNVSTMVDLLEAKNISWATYQENQPYIGFQGDYSQPDYLNTSSTAPYTYYKRKHNPFIIADSVASVPERMNRIRNL